MPAKKVGIRPLGDRVIIKRMEEEEQTRGGIIVPDTAKEKPQRGKVVALGPGKLLDSGERGQTGLKKGDQIYYGKYAGTEVKIDGEDYVILRESDVLAVIQ